MDHYCTVRDSSLWPVQPDSSAAAIVIQSSGCFFMLLISSQGKKKDSHRHVNGKRTA
ncbi:hypothetical protein [Escherichia coli]|uniref:hypothetical protein n=1 Tax=Escherichia coli TaxID=562 RepID=UPI001E3F2268|nr:hypothetical protein [Escherichia coli]MCE3750603.1 hypothetical protein [Escherichia coli]